VRRNVIAKRLLIEKICIFTLPGVEGSAL